VGNLLRRKIETVAALAASILCDGDGMWFVPGSSAAPAEVVTTWWRSQRRLSAVHQKSGT